jgi:tRNA(Ile)-lysidine synthetase-like protein
MKIVIPKGKYILAVSGGVDSMILLDLLAKKPGVQLVVAHFNHGIRTDSDKDERLVTKIAQTHDLPLEIGRAKLGKNTSEDTARQARYDFLEKIRAKHKAKAIITAHHRDDLIETALINTLRGTKRRGLTALADNPKIIRPLLEYDKQQIIDYAKAHKLEWREDTTNQDERYLRNYLRKRLADLSAVERRQFSKKLEETVTLNQEIDQEIATISQLLLKNNQLNRQSFTQLPADVSREVTQYWFRQAGITQTDKKLTDRATTFIKTGKPGAKLPLGKTSGLRNTAKFTELWKA